MFLPTFLEQGLLQLSKYARCLFIVIVRAFTGAPRIDASYSVFRRHHLSSRSAHTHLSLTSLTLVVHARLLDTYQTMPSKAQPSPEPFVPSSAHIALAIALIRAKPAGTSARGEYSPLTSDSILTTKTIFYNCGTKCGPSRRTMITRAKSITSI